jgi:hypothetical protein
MRPSPRFAILTLLLALLAPALVQAEDDPFRSPEQNAPLRLQSPGAGGWSAQCAAIAPYGGVIYPGQAVSLTLTITNTSKDKPLTGIPTLEIVRFGTKLEKEHGQPGNFHSQGHLLTYVPLGEATRYAQTELTLAPGAKATVTWTHPPAEYADFGTYLALVDLPGAGRQPAATFARCHPYNQKDTGAGKGSPLFWSLHHEDRSGQLKLAAALGYRWIRTDGFPNWHEVDQNFPRERKPFDWSRQEKAMDEYRALGLWIQSNMYGSPRGSVTDANWKTYNYVHEPKFDYRWGDFVEEAVRRYCGPDGNGPLQIIDYWNEPWEGGGISAWKSDSIRYRALYKILHTRAHLGSPHIVVGAASSIMNTADKFMTVANWQEHYPIDVFTDHYVQPYCSFGPRLAQRHGIFSIETETWIAFDEHQLTAVATHFMATGQTKVNCNHPAQLAWRNGEGAGWMPKPTVMGANAFLHFVGARPFTRVVFHEHLPWLYQYGSGKDAVFVLSGDRRLLNPAAVDTYNQIKPDGTITVEAAGGKIKAYDVYGNPYPLTEGHYQLPLSRAAVYLQAPGADDTLIVNAVRDATLRKIRPVQLYLEDFTAPLAPGVALELDVDNVLNRPVTGTLTITPPAGVTLAAPTQLLEIKAGAVLRVSLPIKTATPNPANAYPFTATFTAEDGVTTVTDVLHANTISRGTPVIDGNLADWTKSLPVLVQGADLQRDATTAAWRPWEKASDVTAGLAEVRFMYDATHLYVAVRERTKDYTPKPRLSIDPEQHQCFGLNDLAHTYVKGFEPTSPYMGHCVQIGFDVTDFRLLPALPTAPERMMAMEDTDYEYAIWGTPDGGSEIWRSVTPRMKFVHFLPRCFPAGYDGTPRGATAVVSRVGADTLYEIALPLADMPELRPAPGQELHIALRLPASKIELGFGRSRTRSNGLTLLPRWEVHASNEVRWGFLK